MRKVWLASVMLLFGCSATPTGSRAVLIDVVVDQTVREWLDTKTGSAVENVRVIAKIETPGPYFGWVLVIDRMRGAPGLPNDYFAYGSRLRLKVARKLIESGELGENDLSAVERVGCCSNGRDGSL